MFAIQMAKYNRKQATKSICIMKNVGQDDGWKVKLGEHTFRCIAAHIATNELVDNINNNTIHNISK